MTDITPALVKALRDQTDAPMMECKKALVETKGDIKAAIGILRQKSQASAQGKAQHQAAEGTIVLEISQDGKNGALLEVNCQTDFVARSEQFMNFAKEALHLALIEGIVTIETLQQKTDKTRLDLIAKLGENIQLRRMALLHSKGVIAAYGHGDANGIRIGVLLSLKKGTLELAKDLAMQVAAMRPQYVQRSDIPADILAKEKEIYAAQMKDEKKPKEVIEKILEGKLNKFVNEVTLLGQTFVKDSSLTIEALLKQKGAEMDTFRRFEVGEGLEKKADNFAAEVMAQVRGE